MNTSTANISLVSAMLIAFAAYTTNANSSCAAFAQAPQGQSAAPIQGLSRQPSAAAREVLLDPNDTVLLLLDHQTGLFQTVKDVPVRELRANTVALAKIAELGKIPILTTASEPNGSNGPLMSELAAAAPSAKYVARKGEISAWDNDDFVKAVEATGRKTLVIAGVWTSVCVAFPGAAGQGRRLRGLLRDGRIR